VFGETVIMILINGGLGLVTFADSVLSWASQSACRSA
jgi:hypothetical protein